MVKRLPVRLWLRAAPISSAILPTDSSDFLSFTIRPLAGVDGLDFGMPPAFLVQGVTHSINGERLLSFELNHGAAGELHAQVALASGKLDKGQQAQGTEKARENKGVFSYSR